MNVAWVKCRYQAERMNTNNRTASDLAPAEQTIIQPTTLPQSSGQTMPTIDNPSEFSDGERTAGVDELAKRIISKALTVIESTRELLKFVDAYSLRHSASLAQALLNLAEVFDELIPDLAETTRHPERWNRYGE